MATAAQVIANQANAQLSTGPRVAEGKQASSSNAKSHGLTSRSALLPGEDPQEYELFHHSYAAHYLPQTMIEQKMVSELADLEWRLRRVPEFEAQLLNVECRKLTTDADLQPLIEGLDSTGQILAVAFRRLVESKALPNLHHQEARLAHRAEKLARFLHGDGRFFRPTVHVVQKYWDDKQAAAAFGTEDRKNEPKSLASQPELNPVSKEVPKGVPFVKPPEPGRNEPCLCGSGLKFKRCCLDLGLKMDKPQVSGSSSADPLGGFAPTPVMKMAQQLPTML
jgi:hypothetical protein